MHPAIAVTVHNRGITMNITEAPSTTSEISHADAVILNSTPVDVSNDIPADAMNALAAQNSTLRQNAASLLQSLEAARMQWETGAYRTSNQLLYALLARCSAYSGELPPDAAKLRSIELKNFYVSRGYVYKREQPLVTRVVRAIFGGKVDRRRISNYSLVLREAQLKKIAPAELPNWIEERGGLQEIKMSRSPTFVSPKNKADLAESSFNKNPELAVVKSEALSLLADADTVGECCVFIAEQAANGSFIIRGMTRKGGAMTAAFTAFYEEQKKQADEIGKNLPSANDQTVLAAA